MAVASVNVLYWPIDLATESLKLMVEVVIFLNMVDNPLTLSDDATDWLNVLKALNNLDELSDRDIDSDAALIALYILDTLSDNDTETAVIALKNSWSFATESDTDTFGVRVLNALNNLDMLSDNDILSVNPLIELYILAALSDSDMLGSVMVSLLISLLATESVIWCDLVAVSNVVLSPNNVLSNNAPKSRM